MKKLFKEFAEFINKGNALALAIGVIIGGAFTAIVSTINTKIISPLIGLLLGGYDLAESPELTTILKSHVEVVEGVETVVIDNAIYWGALIQSVIDFLLTAIILFLIFKIITFAIETARKSAEKMHQLILKQDEEKAEEPADSEVKEEVAPEVVEEVKEPEVSSEVLLLTEIRDLLSKKDKE